MDSWRRCDAWGGTWDPQPNLCVVETWLVTQAMMRDRRPRPINTKLYWLDWNLLIVLTNEQLLILIYPWQECPLTVHFTNSDKVLLCLCAACCATLYCKSWSWGSWINTFSVQLVPLLASNLEQPEFKWVKDETRYLKCFSCNPKSKISEVIIQCWGLFRKCLWIKAHLLLYRIKIYPRWIKATWFSSFLLILHPFPSPTIASQSS